MSSSTESDDEQQMSEDEAASDDDGVDRTEIAKELSTLSFEELQKLKERIGAKVYNEALFGESKTKQKLTTRKIFKRENKNRPREMSSKKPVSMIREAVPVKKPDARDPRFDPLCGTFDKKTFKETYKFLDNVRSNDLKTLREELKSTQDPDRLSNIKYLIQRMENQNREEKRRKDKVQRERSEKDKRVQMLKEGKRPEFLKKSEKRVKDLVDQYEDLKKTGKLQKHIQRKRKEVVQKERKKRDD